jgi:predicted house-cleaning noncanonical NTP pyrophosphatase (MazG superfamily)
MCKKLSRDKTVENMKAAGITTNYKILEGKLLLDALNQKLLEETHELMKAHDRKEVISELADVLEVMDGLCKAHNITMNELLEVKNSTKEKRGGFEKGIFMETIEMDEDNLWVKHFRKSPDKYPEI